MRGLITRRVGRLSAGASLAMALFGLAGTSQAQFNGDPFDPFRAAYRSSTLPMGTQFGPGRPRVVTPPGLGTVPGMGTPWDAAYTMPRFSDPLPSRFQEPSLDLLSPSNDVYRRYDETFGRVYRPNAQADEQFAEMQEARQKLYFEAMSEADPQRRAELRRQYQDLSRRISLGMSPTASRGPRAGQPGRDQAAAPGLPGAGRPTQPQAATAGGLPQTVRSYDDLAQWSRVINRRAASAGIVRPGAAPPAN